MRPVVVAAVLLLVVLVSVPASVASKISHKITFYTDNRNTKLTALLFVCETGTLQQFCDAKYPVTNCRKDLHGGGWFQFGHNRCVKAFFHTRRLNHIEAKVMKTNTHQTTDSTCDLITQSHHSIRRCEERGGSCIYGNEKSVYSKV